MKARKDLESIYKEEDQANPMEQQEKPKLRSFMKILGGGLLLLLMNLLQRLAERFTKTLSSNTSNQPLTNELSMDNYFMPNSTTIQRSGLSQRTMRTAWWGRVWIGLS